MENSEHPQVAIIKIALENATRELKNNNPDLACAYLRVVRDSIKSTFPVEVSHA